MVSGSFISIIWNTGRRSEGTFHKPGNISAEALRWRGGATERSAVSQILALQLLGDGRLLGHSCELHNSHLLYSCLFRLPRWWRPPGWRVTPARTGRLQFGWTNCCWQVGGIGWNPSPDTRCGFHFPVCRRTVGTAPLKSKNHKRICENHPIHQGSKLFCIMRQLDYKKTRI